MKKIKVNLRNLESGFRRNDGQNFNGSMGKCVKMPGRANTQNRHQLFTISTISNNS